MRSTPPAASTSVWRVRLVAACLLLSAAAFHQGGGRVVPDTKLDLTLAPGAFLARALQVWDPAGHLGQLQNQAYGYLFPMGPFHLILGAAHVPEWVVQRLWWALVLCTAFLGMWRLASAVGVGGPWARYLGAFLFAVSPRFVSEIAVTSIEVWPMAVAPWVLLPLLDPAPQRTRRRILRSAVAFGCIGGVNAVATGAALILPAVWWLTRADRGTAVRRGALWLATCLAAAAWWIAPLLLLGRYSPPFLDWIESAATTTGTASAFSALQGTTPWLAHLRVAEGPTWPAGWVLVSQPILIVATTVPAVIGLAGLASRRLPEHAFWRIGAVTGLALLTLGFIGPAGGPLAEPVRALLDGPLAAFRNIHKFELVLRICLTIGFVHAAHRAGTLALRSRVPYSRELTAVVTGILIVATAAPTVAATLPRAGGYERLPDYWRQTAQWLDAQPGPGSVLIVPAAPFADFTWGATRDEPLQALMRRPFAVRDAVPLGSAGATRFLDEVEQQLRTGRATPALRRSLAAAGIRYVVVRGDLKATVRQAPPLAVHQAIADAGIPRAAAFGPPTGSAYESAGFTVNERTLLPFPSVEIFDVGPVGAARLVPVGALRHLTGGPEDLPAGDADSPSRTVVVGADRDALPADADIPHIVTDGNQRREVNYGRASNNRSPVLANDDPGRFGRRVPDYLVDPSAPRTTLRWEGIRDVRASSSRSDADSLVHTSSGESPAAALDDDPTTRWVSGRYPQAVGEWWEVRLTTPTDLSGARVRVASTEPGSALPIAIDVTTDGGTVTMPVWPDEATLVGRGRGVTLRLPPGKTTRLRLTLRELGPGPVNGFALAEVDLPRVRALPRLVMPSAGTPEAVAVRRREPGRDGCLRQGTRPLCALDLTSAREEASGLHRAFSTDEQARYSWSGTVRVRGTEQAARLLDEPGAVTATATSVRVPSPAARPGAAVDGDMGTGWVADPYDFRPTLTLAFPDGRARRISGVRLRHDPHLAASRPRVVQVTTSDGRSRTVRAAEDGTLPFTATTSSVALTIVWWDEMRSIDAATRYVQNVPVGISEVEVVGAPGMITAPRRDQPLAGRCGDGPPVRLGGVTQATRVQGRVGDVLDGRPLRWTPCTPGRRAAAATPVAMGRGEHTIDAPSSAVFLPESMTLTRADRPRPAIARPSVDVADTDGRLRVPARSTASVLVLPHNANRAWTARTDDGSALAPVRLDGWRQGYLLPPGGAVVVREEFTAQTAYAGAVGVGFLAFLVVLIASARERHVARRTPELTGHGRPMRAAAAGASVAAVALLGAAGGLTGVGAAALVLAGAGVAARLRRPAAPVSAAVALVAGLSAMVGVALQPWGQGGAALTSWWVQAAVFMAFAAATLRVRPRRARARRRSPREP